MFFIFSIFRQIRSKETILSSISELKFLCLLMSQLNKLEKHDNTEGLVSFVLFFEAY